MAGIGTGARRFVGAMSIAAFLTAAQVHANPVTLNMKGADINAVIATVSEVTGKNFIVDPRVKGKVTIVSSKPLDDKEVYQVFLAVLDVHGFTAVPTGKVIKILPDADAKHSGTSNEGIGQEVVTKVVEVKHVAAAQLVPILRPLVPPQGHLAAHAQTNTLIVSDRASNIGRIQAIIDRVDQPSSGEIEIVQLRHAAASEVVRVLTSLQQQERKSEPRTDMPTMVADDRTNSILIGGDKADRLQLRAIISHLDTPSGTTGDTHVVYLRYSKAKDLVPVLTGVGQSQGKDEKGKPQAARAASGKDFDIQAHESSNALVITASPETFRSLESVVRQLDVRRAQVLVEGIIAEVSASKTAQMGVQWVAGGTSPEGKPIGLTNFGNNSIVGIGGAIAQENFAGAAQAIGQGLTLGIGTFTDQAFSFGAIINALASDGAANVLSTPNLLTMDNEEAEIFVGKEVRIPTGSYTTTTGGSNTVNPFTTFTPKQVGVRLKVTPQINEGDAVQLNIEQEVDSITSGNAGQADLVTSQRSIKTSVIVNDGQAVVLGGLITDDANETVQKVPLLGDLPVLGSLFRHKSITNDKTNLMVFLRPTILRDGAVTSQITNSKYNYMRAKQLESREEGTGQIRGEGPGVLPPVEEFNNQVVPKSPARQEVEPGKKEQPEPEAKAEEAFVDELLQ